MSSRLNGGYKGYDGRFLSGGTAIGHIQREQHFLERTQGRLSPEPTPNSGPYVKTLLFEDFEGGTSFIDGTNYTWIVSNGTETNYWVVGDDRSTLSGGTNSAYITNGTGTATNGDNVYTDNGAADSHIILQFEIPTDWWNNGSDPLLRLTFDWRCLGEGTATPYDYGYVRFTTTGTTSVAGTNYAPPGQIGGGIEGLYNDEYITPQDYTTWYTQDTNLSGWSGVTTTRLIWSWHDDAAAGTSGNPPFAVDNILLTYSACTINC